MVVTDKTTNQPVKNPTNPTQGNLRVGGGARGKGLSVSAMREVGKVAKAVADIVLTSVGIGNRFK
jgi:hypothetical protein